jgi:hypothetical protein
VYIFRSDSAFTVTSDATVLLTNGATACNVFWQIPSSMTIGSGAEMVGTIITDTALISLGTGATLQGRALSSIAAVTLLSNQITEPVCSSTSSSTIRVTKEASKKTLRSGPDKVTFTYHVTNRGSVALSDISVKDDKCDSVKYVSGDDNNNDLLDTDENWKYTCRKTVKKTETNTVTAKGTVNGERVKDTDTAKVVVLMPGLPNTGVGPANENSTVWNSIVPMGVFAAFLGFLFFRKKFAL